MKYLKLFLGVIAVIAFVLFLLYTFFVKSISPQLRSHDVLDVQFEVVRFRESPILEIAMSPMLQAEATEYGYANINGPSLIKVPDWIENKLGNYYLYFAHHKGKFIRLAYADSLSGEWTIHESQLLPLSESGLPTQSSPKASGLSDIKKYMSWSEVTALVEVGNEYKKAYEARNNTKVKTQPTSPHLASPDVIIDHENREFRMYFHGMVEGTIQLTKLATSSDGLDFKARDDYLGAPYMRVFRYKDDYYGFAMPGFMYRSRDGLKDFEMRKRWIFETTVRHSGLYLLGDLLYVFFSVVGDQPERIKYTTIDLKPDDWDDWRAGEIYNLLKPEMIWEGAKTELIPSLRGEVGGLVNQLRDPYIFQDDDGQLYMIYTGSGENKMGIVKLNKK